MSSNRQAILCEENTPYQVVTSDIPKPGVGQALVHFTHSGVCYT